MMNKRTYKILVIFLLVLLVGGSVLRLLVGKRPSPISNESLNSLSDEDLIASITQTEAHLELTWQEAEYCQMAVLNVEGILLGSCDDKLIPAPYLELKLEGQLARMLGTYASFTADTDAGSLTFVGAGQQPANPTEQEDIAVWTRLVADETAGEAEGLSRQSIFSWHVSGTDTCADMVVYLTGDADVTACEGARAPDLPYQEQQPDSTNTQPFYHWVYTLKPFAYEQRDETGNLTYHLDFNGRGAAEATSADQAAIEAFAAQLYAQANSGQ
jgi:hypothetical protein